MFLILILVSSIIHSDLTFYFPVRQTNLVSGINYLSSGNEWSENATTLQNDFALFSSNGIKHISVRIMWSTTEPIYRENYAHLSDIAMDNYRRVLDEASKFGIKVNLDFWTQFAYTLGKPSWINDYYDIVSNSSARGYYVRYLQAVVTELKNCESIESWSVMNEPVYSNSTSKIPFQTLFQECYNAVKIIDPTRYVICRFQLAYTPGSGKFDPSVYGIFDKFAVTEYLDPDSPNDTRWSYWNSTVKDLTKIGKELWIVEFGNDNVDMEQVKQYYSHSLQKFKTVSIITRAFAWAWQTRDAGSEAFNICDGTSPKLAYYELTRYPERWGSNTPRFSLGQPGLAR